MRMEAPAIMATTPAMTTTIMPMLPKTLAKRPRAIPSVA
jgi:hypothetical protein